MTKREYLVRHGEASLRHTGEGAAALGSNSLFISCALQRRARVSYLYKWNKTASVLESLRISPPVLIQQELKRVILWLLVVVIHRILISC